MLVQPVLASPETASGRRFWRKLVRGPGMLVGLVVVAIVAVVAIFAPVLAPYDLLELGRSFQPPSATHLLGTDSLGSDVFSNLIAGARTSLTVGLFAAATSAIVGVTVGSIAGYCGGTVDQILMRVTEMFQILPQFFLAVVIVALFGASIWNIIIVIGILTWPATARLTRAEFLRLRNAEFVDAARSIGTSHRRILLGVILPNASPPIIVNSALQISSAILLETSLSFLGLGDPNITSWGTMLHNAQDYFSRAWWMAVFPGLALFCTTLSLNLLADGLNDALNPKS